MSTNPEDMEASEEMKRNPLFRAYQESLANYQGEPWTEQQEKLKASEIYDNLPDPSED